MPRKDNLLNKIASLIKESEIDFNIDEYDESYYFVLYNNFKTIEDSRQQAKVAHKLEDILVIVFLGCISRADEWIEMERFAKKHISTLKKYMELPNGIPSHDTIERVLAIINYESLEIILKRSALDILKKIADDNDLNESLYENKELEIKVNDIYATDGKTNKNSGKKENEDIKEQRNLNTLSIYSTQYQMCLVSKKIDEKTNEITVLPEQLKMFNLKNIIVTADALNTQKEIAKAIIEQKGDYCLTIKGNHPLVYEEISDFFTPELIDAIKESDYGYYLFEERTSKDHIKREYYITDDIKWFSDLKCWYGLTSFGMRIITRTNRKTGEITITNNYYLCSFKPDAYLLGVATLRHWNIENNLHRALDMVFREDFMHTKNKKALQTLNVMNKYVMIILKLIKELKKLKKEVSMKSMRNDFSWDFEGELSWLFKALSRLKDDGRLY